VTFLNKIYGFSTLYTDCDHMIKKHLERSFRSRPYSPCAV